MIRDDRIVVRPRTKKEFTVVFECVDPPVPVFVANTNSEKRARRIYRLFEVEFRENPGGEATLTLYRHTEESEKREYWSDLEDYGGFQIYAVIYEGSEVLETLDYMDLMEEIND